MAEAWFDPQEKIRGQGEWEENASASDDEIEAALRDVFRWLRRDVAEAKQHDRTGFMADLAGSEKCLAAGHREDSEFNGLWLPEDEHVSSWDGDPLCLLTRYGVACTSCESEAGECEARRLDVSIWAAPGVAGVAR